jgi:16S rRNA (uracil1498-N3)-methyltransferase
MIEDTMRIPRGYHQGELTIGDETVLGEVIANHWTRVLRLKRGDAVQLFNGDGREYRALLESIERRRTSVRIEAELAPLPESPLALTLAQGICRGEKMDLVLQKATELGVHALQPLISERTEVRLDAEREARRMVHWQQVIASACEQSGRASIPALASPLALPAWLGQIGAADAAADRLRLMLDPEGDVTLRDLPAPGAAILAVGPEGGFSDHERELLQRVGFKTLRLGPRVLRTETAGLAAIAVLQSHWGDL